MSREEVRRNDEELVRLAVNGDRNAFAELVRLHQHEVFTLALRLTADRELAADVSQEAFMRAWRALPGFRGDARFSTWLYRITVNTAYTLRTRARRHRADPFDHELDGIDDRGMGPDVAAENIDLQGTLLAALNTLSEPIRAVVVLKDVYDWSHSEIAEHLGITVTAAKVRLHRGRKALKDCLLEERHLEDRQ